MNHITVKLRNDVRKTITILMSLVFLFSLVGCENKEASLGWQVKKCEIYSMNDAIEKKGLETVVENTVSEKVSIIYTIYIPLDEQKKMELESPVVNVDIKENGKVIASSLETNKELHAFLSGTKEDDLRLISDFTYTTKDGFLIESDESINLVFKYDNEVYSASIETE